MFIIKFLQISFPFPLANPYTFHLSNPYIFHPSNPYTCRAAIKQPHVCIKRNSPRLPKNVNKTVSG